MPKTFALAEIFSLLDSIPSFATVTFTVAVVLVSTTVIYFLKYNNGKRIRNDGNNSSVGGHIKQAEKLKDVISKEWTITKVQHEYIHKIAKKFRMDVSSVVTRLILQANKEDNKRKKFIFRVVRCDNCSQSSTGGYKVQVNLELDSLHVKWLDNVHTKCNHASVDKTLRIILDFYIGVVLKDNKMEKYFFDVNNS
jgi:hypothetical protein